MKMERRAARNIPDNNNHAMLFSLPLPSSADVVDVVLLVWTLLDSPRPRTQPSFVFMPSHCLPPAFLIVQCSHHRLTSSSPHTNPPLLFLLPETQIKKIENE
jgi:hypothetical protein